jgi:opacity protein-like surface antigen
LKRSLILAIFISANTLFGQSFSVGLKGGLGLTDSFAADSIDGNPLTGPGSKDYVIGPTFEIRLPFSLAVEADALYRPLHFNALQQSSSAGGQSITSWEIPIVGKYRFHSPFVKPYVEAGPTFRALGNLGPVVSAFNEKISEKGFTIGAGVDFKIPFVRISPEIRYSHWGADNTSLGNVVTSNQNQAELLVGVSF